MPVITKDIVDTVIRTGLSARVAEDVTARFKPGDRVLARNMNPTHHTRLPRYVRGKVGTVHLDHGVFVTPDTAAHGLGEHPQHVYSVAFAASELWGEGASSRDKVYIDLWDDYLEKAE